MRKKIPRQKRKPDEPVVVIINNMKTTCNRKTLMKMQKLQSTVKLCIPKLCFARLVREIFQNFNADYRIQALALEALQEAAEWYIVNLLTDANRCCAHAGRVTLQPRDIHLVLDIRGPVDTGNS
ncbi:histone H3.3C-like [Rhynchophorus ferrugineus]|uniref:histone H3.3C-like n=1 Tax=Rhynchophorus ferrugineus TaxID=354439 RepID=UPI003FCD3CFD